MANEIANNISQDDKSVIENMDMEKMISHVTKNVFKMMGNGNEDGTAGIAGFDLSSLMGAMGNGKFETNLTETDTETETEQNDSEIYLKTRDI